MRGTRSFRGSDEAITGCAESRKLATFAGVRYFDRMYGLSGVAALGRAMLSLDRRRVSGCLDVRAAGGQCSLILNAGRLESVQGDRPGLCRIDRGNWLQPKELHPRPAAALPNARRVVALLTCPKIDYEFVKVSQSSRTEQHGPSPRAADFVIMAIREITKGAPLPQAHTKTALRGMRLSRLGQSLCCAEFLWPEERQLFEALSQPTDMEALDAATKTTRARHLLTALRIIGGVISDNEIEGVYSLLLKKRRQLQEKRNAFDLLDLPNDAPGAAAKPALRRLVRDIHPDRMGAVNAGLVGLSEQVLRELVVAERTIASGKAGPGQPA